MCGTSPPIANWVMRLVLPWIVPVRYDATLRKFADYRQMWWRALSTKTAAPCLLFSAVVLFGECIHQTVNRSRRGLSFGARDAVVGIRHPIQTIPNSGIVFVICLFP
jgi:hypothetical protein